MDDYGRLWSMVYGLLSRPEAARGLRPAVCGRRPKVCSKVPAGGKGSISDFGLMIDKQIRQKIHPEKKYPSKKKKIAFNVILVTY